MPIAANLSYLGIAKEATPGTAVAPTQFLPVSAMKPKVVQMYLPDEALRGSNAKTFNMTQGVQYVEYELGGPVYPDTVGFPLAGVLGDVFTTGTAGTPTGTLTAASVVGATSLSTSVAFASGALIQVDTGPLAEIVTTTGASTGAASPYTTPVPALTKPHASGVAVSVVTSPYTHGIATNNSAAPATYTISDYNGYNARQFVGLRFSEVGLRFAGNGVLEYTAKGTGRSTATTTKPAQSFTPVVQQANWLAVATINNAASALVTQGDLTIKRTVEAIHNTDGTINPYDVFAGGDVAVEGSFTAVYEDDSNYNFYLNATQAPLDFTWTQGTGATATQVKLHLSVAQINDADVNRAAGRYVELAVKFTGIANTTDAGASAGYSPIRATLQNAFTSGTYR